MNIFECITANAVSDIDQLLEEQKPDVVNCVDDKGNSPLMYAADKDFGEIGKLLINHGADVNHASDNGTTPLLVAVRRRHVKFIKLLLNNSVDVNFKTRNIHSPLFSSVCPYDADTLSSPIEQNYQVVELLLEHGADVNYVDHLQQTPLLMAVYYKCYDIAKLLLAQPGLQATRKTNINVNVESTLGFNAIHMAFNGNATKNMDIIKLLLEKGSNPNTCRNGRPLISLMPANLNMIDLLLNYGANPNLEDLPNKQTVLTKLIKDFTYATAESVVKRLLQDASIDLDRIQSDGKTYLMQAALQADGYHYIKSLLEAGADPTIVNVNGKTAKYCAINPDTAFQLLAAEEDWIKQVDEAVNNLLRKFMVIRRLKQSGLIERHLCEHIIRLSQYAELCQGPNSNLNKPGLIALARSLYINTTNRTKIELCNDISSKLI